MKYVNQLTDDDLKKIFVCLVKDFYGMDRLDDYHINRDQSLITLRGNFDRVLIKDVKFSHPIKIELDDFNVYTENDPNWVMAQHYHRHMVWKFGKQYAIDCFWDGLGGIDNE